MSTMARILIVTACFVLAFAGCYLAVKAIAGAAAFSEGEKAGQEEGQRLGFEQGLETAVKSSWNSGRIEGRLRAEREVADLETMLVSEAAGNYQMGQTYAREESRCDDAYELGVQEGESLAEGNWGVEWWIESDKGLLKDKKTMHVQFKWKSFLVGEALVRPVESNISEWATGTLELAICDALRSIAPFSTVKLGDAFCQTVLEERKNRLSAPKAEGWDSSKEK